MLEIRCSESGAAMRMREMPSVRIAAKRVCGARDANIRLYRIVFRYACEKVEAAFDISMTRRVFSETRSVVGLSKGTANRITVRMTSRFSCGGQAAYDRDQRSLSIFKTHVLFRRDLRCETKTETPARVVLTFAQTFRIE